MQIWCHWHILVGFGCQWAVRARAVSHQVRHAGEHGAPGANTRGEHGRGTPLFELHGQLAMFYLRPESSSLKRYLLCRGACNCQAAGVSWIGGPNLLCAARLPSVGSLGCFKFHGLRPARRGGAVYTRSCGPAGVSRRGRRRQLPIAKAWLGSPITGTATELP